MTIAILSALLALSILAIGVLAVRNRRDRDALATRDREVRKLTSTIEELETTIEGLDAAQQHFFDLVTHELRSPLAAILGYQELLEDGVYGTLGEEAAEPVQRIGRSARHLVNLVEGLVEITRLRTGTLRPDLETLELGVLLSSVAEVFRTHLTERGLEPTVRMPDALPALRTDRDRLLRVLDLLITSAAKHPAGKGLSLDVARHDHGATVRIDGTAIQVHDAADDPAARFGIRLAIATATAKVLGGELLLDTDDDLVIRALELRIGPAPEPAPRTAALSGTSAAVP